MSQLTSRVRHDSDRPAIPLCPDDSSSCDVNTAVALRYGWDLRHHLRRSRVKAWTIAGGANEGWAEGECISGFI